MAEPVGTHPCIDCDARLPNAPIRFPRYPELKRCDDCRPKALHHQYRASYAKHREKRTAESMAYNRAHPGALQETRRLRVAADSDKALRTNRRHMLKAKYGLTSDDYDAMSEAQGGLCAICQNPETRNARKGRGIGTQPLNIDHDHTTGQIRGLLCARCNSILGFLETPGRLDASLAYIRSSERAGKVA